MGDSSTQLVDKVSSFGTKTKKTVDRIYLIALFVFVAYYACSLTKSTPPFLDILYTVSTFALMLVAVYRIIVGKSKYLSSTIFAVLFVFAGILMFITYFLSISQGGINLTLIVFALIGAMGVKADKVLLSGICGNLVMIINNIVSTALSDQGSLFNDFQDRRYSIFGNNVFYVSKYNNFSSTDLGAHYFWIFAAYLWVRGKKITWGEILALFGLNCLVYALCASNTTLLCICILLVFAVILKLWTKINTKSDNHANNKIIIFLQKLLGYCSKFSFIIFAAIGIILALSYDIADPLSSRLNSLFHFRLSLGFRGITEHGINLFGSSGSFYGMNSSVDGFYNFLDCSYVSLLVISGVLMLIFYVGCMTIIQFRHKKYLYGLLIVAVCALSCLEEHHLSELSYNMFLLILLADFDLDNKIKIPVIDEKKARSKTINLITYPLGLVFIISSICLIYPKYNQVKEMDRLDIRAGQIYSSIQNNIDLMIEDGSWQKKTSAMNSSQYGDLLSRPDDFENVTGEYWNNAIMDPKAHSYYSLYIDSQSADSDIISGLLISDETRQLIGNGSIVVEYDVAEGKVYSVWYSETTGCITIPGTRNSNRISRFKPVVPAEGYSTGG